MFAKRKRQGTNRGFTLVELLVTIAIVAALTAVVAPAVVRHLSEAKTVAARSQVEILRLALFQFRTDTDRFPTTEEGLEALRTKPASVPAFSERWRGPYLSRAVPLDPWGRPYRYESPGVNDTLAYDLYSLGRDGIQGGEGEDADITSWGGALRKQ